MTSCHSRVLCLVATASLAVATPARAQLLVFDPVNIAEAIKLVEKAGIEYAKTQAQNDAINLLSEKLANMGRYKTTPIPYSFHQPGEWTYGAPWLQALNGGDPNGVLYRSVVRQLVDSTGTLDGLPPEAKRAVENDLATINVTDAVAMGGASQAGLLRTFGSALGTMLNAFEGDVINPGGEYHRLTTILDKVAAGALLGRQQDTAANQMLSGALEQLLMQSKRKRDTEVETMNMRIEQLQQGRTFSQSYVGGSADALRSWRQP